MNIVEADAIIPDELAPHVHSFMLPTGVLITHMIASHHDRGGWVIDLGGGFQYLYEDGVVSGRPRHRAYEELGFDGGDDDLKTDADWQAVADRERELTPKMLMALPVAFEVAKAHGCANRHAVEGDRVRLVRGIEPAGQLATVTDPGTEHDHGHYIRVRTDDGDELTTKLRNIEYV